ncbi:MAG: Uncharacterised protein [Polaribacter sp. SA4-10]|nr:MAG: Uncharacterised protein [Polaribacter sp. SA4-10]
MSGKNCYEKEKGVTNCLGTLQIYVKLVNQKKKNIKKHKFLNECL